MSVQEGDMLRVVISGRMRERGTSPLIHLVWSPMDAAWDCPLLRRWDCQAWSTNRSVSCPACLHHLQELRHAAHTEA